MNEILNGKWQVVSALIEPGKIDAESGIIRDVALVSVGEAKGHKMRADLKTLQGFFDLIQGKSIKAYLNHKDDPDPAAAIGLHSGFYIDTKSDPVTLRASQFQVFNALRENDKRTYDTLFEMASRGPDAFGISADFEFNREYANDGGYPLARPVSVKSFDVVGEPAINRGLFSEGRLNYSAEKALVSQLKNELITCIDKPDTNESVGQITGRTTQQKMKLFYAKFSANPTALTRACQLSTELPEGTKEEEIIAKVEAELSEADYVALVAERDALKEKVAKLEADLAAQKPKVEEAAALSKKVGDLTTEVAQLSKARGRFGAAPVVIGEKGHSLKSITRAEFNALDQSGRNSHMSSGGKVTD